MITFGELKEDYMQKLHMHPHKAKARLTCRPSSCKKAMLIVVFVLITALAAATLPASAVVTQDGNFTLTYNGVTYNDNGTSTWNYALVWNGQPHALSHFTIELGTCAGVVSASPEGYQVGNDRSIGIYGIKWQYENFPANKPVNFSITINGHYAESQVRFAAKAGQNNNIGTITGPSVACTVTTTEPPATEPPTTEPPATEPPTTEPPATEPPTTEPPATEPPITDPTTDTTIRRETGTTSSGVTSTTLESISTTILAPTTTTTVAEHTLTTEPPTTTTITIVRKMLPYTGVSGGYLMTAIALAAIGLLAYKYGEKFTEMRDED